MKCEYCAYNGYENGEFVCYYEGSAINSPCNAPNPEPYRYTVVYEGEFFVGDTDGINHADFNSFDSALDVLSFVQNYEPKAYLEDNEYGVSFNGTDWS